MRRALSILTIALVCARVPTHADDLLFDRFASYVEALRVQAGIPGLAAAVIGNNGVLWSRGFGRQDMERALPARVDTPFHLDGLTQVFTASLVMRCVEEGHFSLDDRLGQLIQGAPEPDATLREVLTHTSASGVFSYRPERIAPVATVIARCSGQPFQEKLANGLDWAAMFDSVPGADVVQLTPAVAGIFAAPTLERYGRVLSRLATPYVVDSRGRPSPTQYVATTLTPTSGAISTVDDLVRFVLALRNGVIVRPETLAVAWRPPFDARGQRLPHGLGWFVQSYGGETIVWQFGVSDNASSSLMVTVPARGVTMVLLANSDGLVKAFPLAAGDLGVSPFGRLFLGLFVR